MAAGGNLVGISFEALASRGVAQIQAAMDTVINAEIAWLHPILRGLFLIFIGRQFFLMSFGRMTLGKFIDTCIRAGIIILLLVHGSEFVARVKDPIFSKVPQAIASMVSGNDTSNSTQSIAQQFDKISAAADAITARTQAANTSWSVASLVNSASANFANMEMQFVLACIVGIWLLAQRLLAIILCFGPLILVFELFDRTRGWVDQWIGKLVGMTAFGLATSILLSIQLQGMQQLMASVQANTTASTAEAVGNLGHVVSSLVLDLFSMAALPTIVAFGSGVAASLAAPSALVAMRSMSLTAQGASALGGAARSAAGGVGGGARNAIAAR